MSKNGRYVVFASDATNLVSLDLNGATDVFVRDLAADSIERVSLDSLGTEANGSSNSPSISADGRFVVFVSDADNLVAGDANLVADVFLHDRDTGTTTRISVDSVGAEADGASSHPRISGDGNLVVFSSLATNLIASDTNSLEDVFLRDCLAGSTSALSTSVGSPSDGISQEPVISADGNWIAFVSFATNLVAADTDTASDVLLYDVTLQQLSLASKDSVGTPANGDCHYPAMTADGGLVAFSSAATNLVSDDTNGFIDVFLVDSNHGLPVRISLPAAGEGDDNSSFPVLSGNGRTVTYVSDATNLFTGDTNGLPDVLAYRDLPAAETRRASVDTSGTQGNDHSNVGTKVSGNGRCVLFASRASNLVAGDTNAVSDMFLYNLQKSKTVRVSVDSLGAEGNGACFDPAISEDGCVVAFASDSSNLVAGDTNNDRDVFVHELDTGITTRVSVSSLGVEGNNDSHGPWLSGDGRYVTFYSEASNLVGDDNNRKFDVFLHDRDTGVTTRESLAPGDVQLFLDSIEPSISADGTMLAFESLAAILVPGDTNVVSDCFVKNLQTGAITAVSADSMGNLGDQKSDDVVISSDGTYCTFESNATNLVPGDTNGTTDIFGYDLTTSTITRLSVDSQGGQSNGLSDDAHHIDGRHIIFRSEADNLVDDDTNLASDVFLHDRVTGITERVSVDSAGVEGDNNSEYASISAGGTTIAMRSEATNLVTGDTNGVRDSFARVRCEADFINFGVALPGSGSIEPLLTGASAPCSQFTLQISQGLGGALSFLLLSTGRSVGTLFSAECYINFAGFWKMIPIGLSGPLGVPGAGSVALPGRFQPGVMNIPIYFQAAIVDSSAPQGFAMTRGLLFQTHN